MKHFYLLTIKVFLFCLAIPVQSVYAQTSSKPIVSVHTINGLTLLALVISLLMLFGASYLLIRIKMTRAQLEKEIQEDKKIRFSNYINSLDSEQIERILNLQKNHNAGSNGTGDRVSGTRLLSAILLPILLLTSSLCYGQDIKQHNLAHEPGIIITIILIMVPLLAAIIIMIVKTIGAIRRQINVQHLKEAEAFAGFLKKYTRENGEQQLAERKASLDYQLNDHELSGSNMPKDFKGFISNIQLSDFVPFVRTKKKAVKRPHVEPGLEKLVIAYICFAAFWLVFGTSVGEYLGIKFVSPDIDHVSWLSFGRLRPVHTNAVFWGWASMAMIGLAYYVVPRVSNTKIHSLRLGWYTLYCINASVIFGSLCLMAGINNGGGEYREYIWPAMLPFAVGLIITLFNFIKTAAKRTTREIYISNWYIVSAIMFVLVITTVAYLPYWQHGLGETIVQGYYMHQGVGMWFMFCTLGLVYYFLPQHLNKPIYSYSLGILAFWSQILFYTTIGTHHFVFSSIPWWLQTTAIVGSIGMIIPVGAGFTNFILTFRGVWHKVASSYTLPFFLVGILFYITASLQGTAEAFRYTNLIWHFTDFVVAHSHLTMYGIISFFLWAGIYTLLPRLTGQEAPQITVGAHFWLAFIGLLFYTVPLMYGATLKGLAWMDGKPFTDGLVLMAPYWLWRAIGGSLMWMSHLFFAYNVYKMVSRYKPVDVKEAAIEKLGETYINLTIPLKTGA